MRFRTATAFTAGWRPRPTGSSSTSRPTGPVSSRRSGRLAPPDMRDGVEAGPRGRVRLTPELEAALVTRLLEETAPLAEAGKARGLSAPDDPGLRARQAPPRRARRPGRGLRIPPSRHRATPPRLGTRDATRETFGWFADHGVAFVTVDAPSATMCRSCPRPRRSHPRRSGLPAPARAQYRRLPDRQVRGGALRLALRRRRARAGQERVLAMAEEASEVHVAFNNNRGDDAPTAAQRFRPLLGQAPPEKSRPSEPAARPGAARTRRASLARRAPRPSGRPAAPRGTDPNRCGRPGPPQRRRGRTRRRRR